MISFTIDLCWQTLKKEEEIEKEEGVRESEGEREREGLFLCNTNA